MRKVVLHKRNQNKAKYFTVIGLTNLLGEPIFSLSSLKSKRNRLILGLELIFLRIKLDMRMTKNNNIILMLDLISIIQVGLAVLTKGIKFPVLSNF